MRVALCFLAVGTLGISHAQDAAGPAITSAKEIRGLTADQAAEHRPVRLRAVVTAIAPERTIFLHDGTAGTFVSSRKDFPPVEVGQLIEVEGVTYPGLYVPGIQSASLRMLGEGKLPAPRPVTFDELASGVFNYEWVEVRGTVRAFQSAAEGRGVVTLAMGDGRLAIHANRADAEHGMGLVDALVRVSGLAAGFINDKRQLVAPHLRVADLAAFQIEEPAPDEPFDVAATPAANLLQFRLTAAPGRRVKVQGTVTHQEPGRALFLRDEKQGLMVETTQDDAVRPGDQVEVLGFAEMGTFSAVLRDAVFRLAGHGDEPTPAATKASEILNGAHDADFVQLDAELLETLPSAQEYALILRADDVVFGARLAGASAAKLAPLRPGSLLRLTGVARAEHLEFLSLGFRTKPRSFELLLRAADDVTVLRAPSWWTKQRLAAGLGILASLATAALVWAVALRRRVAAQTAIIGEKLKVEAAAEERERIAREFHDTLEQELVGLSLRLDAATTKVDEPRPRELLEGARRLVQNIQTEARSLVRNLRARALGDAPLPEAIDRAVEALRHERTIEVRTSGEPRRLDGIVEHELLRIAQEATTNAVKHGQATRIGIALAFSSSEVRLSVTDNGRGCDPERDTVKPGHFGLLGIRERVQKMGGQFALRSQPGAGAKVEATVPLSPAP